MSNFGQLVADRIRTDDLRGAHRLFYVRSRIEALLNKVDPTLIALEDYAMGAGGKMNNNVFNIGELGGILKVLFWDRGIEVLMVGPTVMKSIIAHHGRAEKPQISEALYARFGLSVTQNDAADAAGLMVVGEMKAGVRAPPPKEGKTDRFQSIRDSDTIQGRPQRPQL